RKVRTPQGSAPGNARSGQPEGQWHRKHTARMATLFRVAIRVRVKRCGKSAPRPWQHGWQAKPRTEQDQIGRLDGPSNGLRVGRWIPPAMVGLEEWSSPRVARKGEGGNRIRLTAHCDFPYFSLLTSHF